MNDPHGQDEDTSSSGDPGRPVPPPGSGGVGGGPPGGSGYPPPGGSGYPPPGGSGYPPPGGSGYPPPGGSGYPPPTGQGYPPPPGQGYPPPPGQGYRPPEGQPFPQGGGPDYPGGAWDSEKPRGWSGLAIASFVVGLLVPCIGVIVAIPLGIIALVQIRKSGDKGKVFAILGIVIPVLWLAAVGGFIAWIATSTAERDDAGTIVESGRIDFQDLRVDDCVKIDGLGDDDEINPFDLEGVPCDDEHNAEVAAIVPLEGGDDYPGESDIEGQAREGCAGEAPRLPSGLELYPLYPTESLWDEDEDSRRAICFAVRSDSSSFSGRQLN